MTGARRETKDHPQGVPAGWYPDPGGTQRLRAWDGERWTDGTRPRWTRARRPRTDGTNAIIVVLLSLFATSGTYAVVTGSSSTNNNAARFDVRTTTTLAFAVPASPPTSAAAVLPVSPGPAVAAPAQPAVAAPTPSADPCSLVLDAFTVASALRDDHLPVSVVGALRPEATQLTAPCSAVTFRDARADGTQQLAVYRSGADAAASVHGSDADRMIVVGNIVLTLDPSLASARPSYSTDVAAVLRTTRMG
jgi:uncharacterized protein DUF2510